jgi:UDP-2,3-diacylglucosamine pyrophosphatase LpxH
MDGAPTLYVAGDVHLGQMGNAFAQWLDWLSLRPAARLVILGDLFDWWLDSDQAVARHAALFERLRLLRARGWRIDLVRGNRELAAGRRLETAIGGIMHARRLDITLGRCRLRIVHGDRLCHDPGYRAYVAIVESFPFAWYQRLHPMAMQEAVARGIRQRSERRHHRPRPPTTGRPRVFIDRRRVQAAGRGVDVVVAGHIHQSWRRRIGGVDLILVGDWPGSAGHWVEGFADGRLERVRREFADLAE